MYHYQFIDYPMVTFDADVSGGVVRLYFYVNDLQTTKEELERIIGLDFDEMIVELAKGGIKIIEKG